MADLFDVVVARKLSGGGGGTTVEALSVTQNGTYTAPSGKAYSPVTVNVSGGSSDFSTATVNVVDNTIDDFTFAGPCAISDPEEGFYCSMGNIYVEQGANSFSVILFKGKCLLYAPTGGRTISISGDIEDDGGEYYYITGDCTITIS
jgi:hypothetical protein